MTRRRSIAFCIGFFLAVVPSLAQQINPSLYQNIKWRNIGPFRAGRTVGAVGIPNQPNVFFIGVNNGGVWKTTDAGRTWQPLFDEQPTGSIGDVAVAESNPNILYAGSGEGLPLRRGDWATYLNWAVDAFRLAASGVRDDTQIHTHMCYCEFNDIIESVAALDADVISIETSRSAMELLEAFVDFRYPAGIGPGVWDIHSPRIPSVGEMEALLRKALVVLSPGQVWVNPDCGLKTRGWAEVAPALENLVAAARRLRGSLHPKPLVTA